MLVLSQKVGNRIVIAGDIEVIVLRVNGSRVRLGVNAPRHVSVVRDDTRECAEHIDLDVPRLATVLPDTELV